MWEGGVFNNFPRKPNFTSRKCVRFGLSTCQGLSLSLSLSQICHWPWNFEVVQQWECIAQAMDHPSIYMLPSCNNNSQTREREREREEITIQGGDDIVDPYNTSAIGCTTTLKSLIKKDPRILHKISLTTSYTYQFCLSTLISLKFF